MKSFLSLILIINPVINVCECILLLSDLFIISSEETDDEEEEGYEEEEADFKKFIERSENSKHLCN